MWNVIQVIFYMNIAINYSIYMVFSLDYSFLTFPSSEWFLFSRYYGMVDEKALLLYRLMTGDYFVGKDLKEFL